MRQVVVVHDKQGRFVAAHLVDGLGLEEALEWCQPRPTDQWQVVEYGDDSRANLDAALKDKAAAAS